MAYYSYVVPRDYGFAPNPFYGVCTLATCKPIIRRGACVGDWIFGNSSVSNGFGNRLIFAMKITEKISFNEYWEHPLYQIKKPKMTSTLKNMYGDNIYHYSDDEWIQSDSHHSLDDGETNYINLNNDTQTDAVLISDEFFYFGGSAIKVPKKFIEHIVHKNRNHSRPDNKWGDNFVMYLKENYELGVYDAPALFEKFKRYNGK